MESMHEGSFTEAVEQF